MLARILFPVVLCLLTVAAASSPLLANRAAPVNASLSALQQAVRQNSISGVKQVIAEALRSGEIVDIINVRDAVGRTPLHDAVIHHHWEIMGILLAAGADTELTDKLNKMARNYAVADFHNAEQIMLIKEELKNKKTSRNPFRNIVKAFRVRSITDEEKVDTDKGVATKEKVEHDMLLLAIARLVRAQTGVETETARLERLQVAALSQERERVQQLIVEDATVWNLLFHKDLTPLLQDEKTRTLLIEVGSMDVTDGNGKSLLIRALLGGHVSFAKSLIRGDADVNAADSQSTPLTAVVEYDYPEAVKLELLQLLRDKGADLNAANKNYQETALMRAAERGDLLAVRFLLNSGAKVTEEHLQNVSDVARATIEAAKSQLAHSR